MDNTHTRFLDLYNSAGRISSAVFLVFHPVDEVDILRTKIRELAIKFVSDTVYLESRINKTGTETLLNLELLTTELASLIGVASVSDIVSSMNSDILRTELNSFLGKLKDIGSSIGDSGLLSKSFFHMEKEEKYTNLIEKPKIGLKKHASIRGHSSKNELREQAIISLISAKGTVSIKDISKSIKGCSEKTIQRKLLSLVDSGVLIRTGERRWSRYSLSTLS